MQEQIDRESIALTVNTSKLTAKTLAVLLQNTAKQIAIAHKWSKTPRGKQSVKKLMGYNVPTNTIPIDGDKGLFEKVARKWNVDYAFNKTGKNKYLLLFKSGQADAITAAFSEYSKLVLKREREKRLPIAKQLNQASKQAEKSKAMHKEKNRVREAVRE